MALPMVGMEAILLIQRYERNAKRLQKLNKQIEDSFKQTSKSGKSIGDQFGSAASKALSFNFSLGLTVTQLAGVATALGVAAVAGKKAIQAFQELAMETNRLQLLMGATAKEVAGFRLAAERAGVEMTPMSRALMILEKRIGDYQLRTAAGVKRTNEFERASKAIGIELTNQDGSLKSTMTILGEIADWYEKAGASVQATAILTNLFGESARHIIPVLQDGEDAIRDATEAAEKYGLVLTEKDIKAARNLTKAQADLKASTKGLTAMFGSVLTPAYEAAHKAAADLINTVRQLSIIIMGGLAAINELGKAHTTTADAGKKGLQVIKELSNTLNKEEKAAQEAAQAEAALAGARDAANLEAIKIRENTEELIEQYGEKALKAQERFDQQWEDMMIRRGRTLEDVEQRRLDRLDDIERNYQRRKDDIMAAHHKLEEDRAKDNSKRRQDLERQLQDALTKLLARHLEKMRQIRQDFQDNASDAARRNDAVAFLQAKRRRDRELRDERERYKLRRNEILMDFDRRRKELKDSIREQEKLDEDRLSDQLARARLAYERQLEDLGIALERQERDRKISNDRQEADLNRSLDRQEKSIGDWFDKEAAMYAAQMAEVEKILGDSQGRRLISFEDYLRNMKRLALDAAGLGVTRPSWMAGIPAPGETYYRAGGGIDLLTSPTTIVGGEAGPEVHAWAPMSGSTHHSFDPFNVNVGGVGPQSEAQIVPIIMNLLRQVVREMR